VVTAGAAGTVIVALAVLVVSATEVAVTVAVCAELVAAGAVKVAPVVDVLESVPPPLTVQVTPALFRSLVTVADSVVESVPSTVVADAVTATLTFACPPQPIRLNAHTIVITSRPIDALILCPDRPKRCWNIVPP
jgi:hypothetical protein